MEDNKDKLSRLKMMVNDKYGKWDLSDNDIEAIKYGIECIESETAKAVGVDALVIKLAAEEIVEMLFTDGQKRKANRLVMEFVQEKDRAMMDGTGWCKEAVKDKIREILVGQLDGLVKP